MHSYFIPRIIFQQQYAPQKSMLFAVYEYNSVFLGKSTCALEFSIIKIQSIFNNSITGIDQPLYLLSFALTVIRISPVFSFCNKDFSFVRASLVISIFCAGHSHSVVHGIQLSIQNLRTALSWERPVTLLYAASLALCTGSNHTVYPMKRVKTTAVTISQALARFIALCILGEPHSYFFRTVLIISISPELNCFCHWLYLFQSLITIFCHLQ